MSDELFRRYKEVENEERAAWEVYTAHAEKAHAYFKAYKAKKAEAKSLYAGWIAAKDKVSQ